MIVGELINTSRKLIKETVDKRDGEYIHDIARNQVAAGADYLDINCGNLQDNEIEVMKWLIENVQAAVDISLSIDTPNPAAMELGISLAYENKPLMNSVTGEKKRLSVMLPLIKKYRTKIVALCMDDQGIPQTAEDRLRVAQDLVAKLLDAGAAINDIYLDPLAQPLGADDRSGFQVLNAIKLIRQECPGVHLICGLSNISYGQPNRQLLNRIFMIQTMTMGMDAYILDPLDKTLMGLLCASRALLSQDPFCKNYLTAHRKGLYSGD